MTRLMAPVALEGVLQTGLGEGAGFIALDWVEHQFFEKFGFWPYPGTLNLSLCGGEWGATREALLAAAGIALEPPPGFCAAKCFPVRIDDRIDGAVVIPDVDDYPADKLEIVAPVAVREALGIGDGDPVMLTIALA